MNDRQAQHLLGISQAIATVQNRTDLLRVICEQIQPVLPFADAGIAILNPAGDQYYEFLTYDALPSDINQWYVQAGYTDRWLPVDMPIQKAFEARSPLLLDIAEEARQYPGTLYLPLFEQGGIRQAVCRSLQVRGQTLGCINFNSKQIDGYSAADFPLVNGIADVVGVAVANILAREEILEREREKSMLLEISNYIATIRDKVELLQTIHTKLQPIFRFDATGLFIINEDENYHYDITVEHPEIDGSAMNRQLFEDIEQINIPHRGTAIAAIYDELRADDSPLIFDFEELFKKHAHPYAQLILQCGYKETMASLLRVRGEAFGILFFNSATKGFFTKKNFRLFQSVTDQLAVAVANMLANEEILEREREKTRLLEISESIAQVQHSRQLLRIIYDKVRLIFPYDNAGLFVFDQTGETYREILDAEVLPDDVQTKLEQADLLGPYVFKSHHPDLWIYGETATIYSLTDQKKLLSEGSLEWKVFTIGLADGLKQMIGGPLYCGGRKIGLLSFNSRQADFYTPKHLPLFQSVADQIAVAVANILAREEILEREREKTLQLAVNQALTEPADWQAKFERLARLLQPVVPYDYAVLSAICPDDRNHQFSFYRTGADEYQIITIDDFLRRTGLTLAQYLTLRNALHQPEAMLLNGDDFVRFCHQYAFKKLIAQTYGLQSNLVLPLPLSRDCRFTLSLYSRRPDTYRPAHLSQLQKLQAIMSLTLDKLLAVENIEARSEQLRQENTYLWQEVQAYQPDTNMVGFSPAMQAVFRYVAQVAPTTATVLVQGETGTGKELIARAIHAQSPRRERVMIKINCATLPAQLIESELFGHEKGAFTGAFEKRLGKFELANGSTIFLDEIGELPLDLQAKLLRVLQEREFERIGGKVPIRTDVRVIAATNRNLQQEVAEGRFRADLYYRLSVFPIHLPPLRERRDDILNLAMYFGQKFSTALHRPFRGIRDDARQQLLAYHWPGNIRELENLIEQAVILANGEPLVWGRPLVNQPMAGEATALQSEPVQAERDRVFAVLRQTKGKILGREGAAQRLNIRPAKLEDYEREFLLNALKETGGKVRGLNGAADLVGLKPNAFDARLIKLGIQKEHTYRQ